MNGIAPSSLSALSRAMTDPFGATLPCVAFGEWAPQPTARLAAAITAASLARWLFRSTTADSSGPGGRA